MIILHLLSNSIQLFVDVTYIVDDIMNWTSHGIIDLICHWTTD